MIHKKNSIIKQKKRKDKTCRNEAEVFSISRFHSSCLNVAFIHMNLTQQIIKDTTAKTTTDMTFHKEQCFYCYRVQIGLNCFFY